MIEIRDIEEESRYYDFVLPPEWLTAAVGDIVEIQIYDGKRGEVHRGEVLHFKVLSAENGEYSGQLIDEPKKLQHVCKGAYLRFEPRHIISVRV